MCGEDWAPLTKGRVLPLVNTVMYLRSPQKAWNVSPPEKLSSQEGV